MVAIGPPLGALMFHVYIKTDWGISLFFLMPLALIAIPALRVRKIALLQPDGDLAGDFARRAGGLALDRRLRNERKSATAGATYRARSELARELTRSLAHALSFALAGGRAYTDTGQPITFYSPDHPAPLTPDEPWSSGLTSLDEAKRLGLHRHLRYHGCNGCRRARHG